MTRALASVALVLVSLACAPAPSMAGPNAGGVLLLHANASVLYTPDSSNYCGQSGLSECEAAVVSVPADPTHMSVIFAIAAFPPNSAPRMAGVTFGISYEESDFVLISRGACADFELSSADWPAPGSGTALSWSNVRTAPLTEVYWFAGYAYSAEAPTTFSLQAHPTQGASFADDGVPSTLDEVTSFGTIGFGQAGQRPCPIDFAPLYVNIPESIYVDFTNGADSLSYTNVSVAFTVSAENDVLFDGRPLDSSRASPPVWQDQGFLLSEYGAHPLVSDMLANGVTIAVAAQALLDSMQVVSASTVDVMRAVYNGSGDINSAAQAGRLALSSSTLVVPGSVDATVVPAEEPTVYLTYQLLGGQAPVLKLVPLPSHPSPSPANIAATAARAIAHHLQQACDEAQPGTIISLSGGAVVVEGAEGR